MVPLSRRRLLQAVGVTALAGCTSTDDDETIPGDRYPMVDDWLGGRTGAATATYYGDLRDRTGASRVTIEVGTSGNGGNFAYKPPGVVVDRGTTIVWDWVRDSGQYNVVADSDTRVGTADYAFRSGPPESGDDVRYEHEMDRRGIALYYSENHRFVGMKGAVVVP